jgi:7-cyano-7-deazaguanine synthase
MMRKLVLALSGGMDSTVLLHMAAVQGFEVIDTLSFDYGQRHGRELENVAYQIAEVENWYPKVRITNRVIDARFISDLSPVSSLTNKDIANPNIAEMAGDPQPVTYVPFRNMQFLSMCCAYAETLKADTVWYGAAQADSLAGMWDGDQNFVNLMNNVIILNRMNKITIEAPLLTMSKKDIVLAGVKMKVNFAKTWTCYSNHPNGLADLTTPSSNLRVRGFVDAGYRDPIVYIQQAKIDALYESSRCKAL